MVVIFAATAPAGLAQTSEWVRQGQTGLVYQMDSRGDRVLNYAEAGYEGGASIPDVSALFAPAQVIIVAPQAGDNRAQIQAAINQVSSMPLNANGYRGVVQLQAGQYDIASGLEIRASGVILRGVGDGASPATNTILRSTTTQKIDIIEVASPSERNTLIDVGAKSSIRDKVVPAGATSFRVDNAATYEVGEWVNVERTPTQAWFDFVTESFPNDPGGDNWDWNTSQNRFTFQQERKITRIEDDRIFIHAPLSHNISQLTNGTIQRYNDNRISRVGIEGIRGSSVFDAGETETVNGSQQFVDEDHADNFIVFSQAENSWARGVTGEHLAGSAVKIGGVSRSITVEDAAYVSPVSEITGGRRYAFLLNGGQFILMKDLDVDEARRAFINNSTFNGFNRGPNVFLNGEATNSFSQTGPHSRYSTGTLYDNITDDHTFEARKASSPVGHGWRGAHTVFWNSTAGEYEIRNPPGSRNFLIGAESGTFNVDPSLGTIDAFGSRVAFNDPENPQDSLYLAQRLEMSRNPDVERREYWLGDFDEFEADGAGSADEVYVDPAWFAAVDGIGGFRADHPIVGFDASSSDQSIPLSFAYELAPSEEVVSAVLTLATRRLGTHSDNDVIFVEELVNPFSPGSREAWGVEYDSGLQVMTLELFGDVGFLQDGLLNLLVTDDRPVDWAHLILNVAPITASVVGDYDDDGFVSQADLDLVLLNWGTTGVPAGWVNEQPAGLIGQAQLDAVLLNWGNTAVAAGIGGVVVPEPSGFLAALGIPLLGRRQSRAA